MALYEGLTEAEWLQKFDAVKAEDLAATNGERFISVSSAGKSFTRRVRSRDEIQADYGQCLQALQTLNPTVYGYPTQKVNTCFSGWQPK